MKVNIDTNVVFPVYVVAKDCGDVMRFDSERELYYLEAVDVRNDKYEGCDANGRILRLEATEDSRFCSGDVLVGLTDELLEITRFQELSAIAEKVK